MLDPVAGGQTCLERRRSGGGIIALLSQRDGSWSEGGSKMVRGGVYGQSEAPGNERRDPRQVGIAPGSGN
jgi:hypothetical protein